MPIVKPGVVLLCLFLIPLYAFGQTTLYVDSENGSDAYTGTVASFQSGTLGPKATIEGAVRAAGNATAAIVLLSSTYDRDESGVVTPEGTPGGNDADGVTIESDHDLVLRITRDGDTRFPQPVRVVMGAGARLHLHGGQERTRTLRFEQGLDLVSGTIDERLMAATAALHLEGTTTLRTGAVLKTIGRNRLTGTLNVEPDARFDGRLLFDLDGVVNNAGALKAYLSRLDSNASYEAAPVFFHNERTGTARLSGVSARGAVLWNEGTLAVEDVYFVGGERIGIYCYVRNHGTIDIDRKATFRSLLTEGAPDPGAQILIRETGDLEITDRQVHLARNTSLGGSGRLTVYGLTVDGAFDFRGEVHVEDSMAFSPDARLVSLGRVVRVNGSMAVPAGRSMQLDELHITGLLHTEADLTVGRLHLGGALGGRGDVTVQGTLTLGAGRLEGTGTLLALGQVETTGEEPRRLTVDRPIRLAGAARAVLQRMALGGTGSLTIEAGAELDFHALALLDGAPPLTAVNRGRVRYVGTADGILPLALTNRGVLDLAGPASSGKGPTLTPRGALTQTAEGTIVGRGGLGAALVQQPVSGRLIPGTPGDPTSTGTMDWQGSLALSPETEVHLDVTDAHDRLRVAGPVALNGGLRVDFPTEDQPRFGYPVDLVTYASRTGTFRSVDVRLPVWMTGVTPRLEYGETALTLVLEGLNRPPETRRDTAFVHEHDSVLIDVLTNDVDVDGDPIALLSVDLRNDLARIEDNGTPDDPTDDGIWFFPRANAVNSQYVPYWVRFGYTVGDGRGGTAKEEVHVSITYENDPPYILSRVWQGASVGLAYSGSAAAYDGDDPYSVSILPETLPDWLTYEVSGRDRITLTGTPTKADIGRHPVRLLATAAGDTIRFEDAIDVLPDLDMDPAQGASVQGLQPVLDWTDRETAAYRVQITTAGGYETPKVGPIVLDTLVTESTFAVPGGKLEFPDFWYQNRDQVSHAWRVGLVDAQGDTRWSGFQMFLILPPPAPPTPALLWPPDGARIRLGDTLAWTKSEGAVNYRPDFSIVPAAPGKKKADEAVAEQDSITYSTQWLEGNTTYAWRVQARGVYDASAYSPARQFSILPMSDVRDLGAEGPVGYLKWADVDQDGDLDLLTTSRSEPFTQLYRTEIDWLNAEVALVPIESGLPPLAGTAEWTDFDSDGRFDVLLVGVEGGTNRPVTDLYSWQDDRFVKRDVALPVVHGGGRWGDYDNDGDPDLVLTDRGRNGSTATYLLRNDGGRFTDVSAGRFDVGGSVEWEDYDYDGDLDLLIAGRTGAGAFVARIYEQAAGAFRVADELEAPADPTAVWVDPYHTGNWHVMVHGLLDGTPHSELYLNTEHDGLVPSGLSFQGSTHPGIWGDVDADGDLDLLIYAVEDNTTRATLYVNALGTLDARKVNASTFAASPLAEEPATQTLDAVWIELDGRKGADVLTGGLSAGRPFLRMLRNQKFQRDFRRPRAPQTLTVADFTMTSAVLSWAPVAEESGPGEPHRYNLVVGTTPEGHNVVSGLQAHGRRPNVGGRTTFEIRGLHPDSTYYWRVQAVHRSGYAGPFSDVATFVPRAFTVFDDVSNTGDAVLAVGDTDRDGQMDVLTNASLVLNTGVGFQPAAHPDLDQLFLHDACFADFDRDGDLDIGVVGHLGTETFEEVRILYQSKGAFTTHQSIPIAPGTSIQAHDFDNDGDADLLVGLARPGIFWNEDGTFTSQPALLPLLPGTTAYGRPRFHPADYDLDGDLDLLVVDGPSLALLRNESGAFAPVDPGLPAVSGDVDAAWQDYDEDGDPDLIVSSDLFGRLQTLGFKNEGGFLLPDLEVRPDVVGLGRLPWGDVDNDGDRDLAVHSADSLRIFRDQGEEVVFTSAALPLSSVTGYAWVDLDGDRDADLVAGSGVVRNNTLNANAPPAPLGELRAAVRPSGDVRLTWAPGSDDTTPATALSYAVRVGTSPGAVDVVSPDAIVQKGDLEGRRTAPGYGNVSHRTSFLLRNLLPGQTYYWSVQAIDNSFAGGVFAEEQSFTAGASTGTEEALLPTSYTLHQNYPNPFNGLTHIAFELPEAGPVRLEVFDIMGRRVAALADRPYAPGYHRIDWHADRLASGVYFYRLTARGFTDVRRMVIAR